jgi:replicative DNA helicase
MLAMESGVEMRRLRRGELSENALTCVEIAARKHTQSQLIIDDTPLRSTDIRNRLKRLKLKFGVKFVVIDFIQLVTPSKAAKNQSREREVAEASAALKEAAKEFDMTIVALSQLSRQVESRPDKRPMLSDLRDSGSLEQDADLVLFMHRPEYYGQKYFDKDGNESAQNQAEIIVSKGRDTGTGSYRVYFTKATAHFENLPDAQNNGHGHPAIVQDDSSDYPF